MDGNKSIVTIFGLTILLIIFAFSSDTGKNKTKGVPLTTQEEKKFRKLLDSIPN
jgi:hypothetical protein